MARVFRGKMAIPGDQMEAYLEHRHEALSREFYC